MVSAPVYVKSVEMYVCFIWCSQDEPSLPKPKNKGMASAGIFRINIRTLGDNP